MKYCNNGPAVMLCNSKSLFPAQLAAYWRSQGLDVVLVTCEPDDRTLLPDRTPIVEAQPYETTLTRLFDASTAPITRRLEQLVPHFKKRFMRITGERPDSEFWKPEFSGSIKQARAASRTALALRPRYVFGQEVASYGLATVLCRGVPRILFPWGWDVMLAPEISPFHFIRTKYILHRADLIVPSSTTAARHILRRFGLPAAKVQAVSWGVDRRLFKRADIENRKRLCEKWKIDPRATILLNVRRFHPAWGGFVATDAFITVALENPSTHFIILGGLGTEKFTARAKAKLQSLGLTSRFTLLEGDMPLGVCAELMSISDVFVSLLGRGDMRSLSVLQATASGAVPVVTDSSEHREMERNGFAGFLVRPDSVEDVVNALKTCLSDGERLDKIRADNFAYLATHEDYTKQMDKLLALIESVCSAY